MTEMYASIFALRLRPLAAALATLCAASTAARELPLTHTTAPASAFISVANCNDSGAGSLREALNNIASDGLVDLTRLTCSTISLTTGALVFGQSNLRINGPGKNKLAIDGRYSSAVLYHLGNGLLTVQGISITKGQKYRSDVAVAGACVHANNSLLLDDVSVSHCNTLGGGIRSAYGGAVWTHGVAGVFRSTISASSVVANGSGNARGGGLYALGGLVMQDSTISDNVAFSQSPVKSYGGGVVARGSVSIIGSTISSNHADVAGGVHLNDYAGTPASIIESTVSGNTATTIVGGVFALPTLSLYNSTIAFNTARVWTIGYNGQHFAAGVHVSVLSQLHMRSTIVSNNTNTGAPLPTVDLTGPAVAGANNNVMFCDTICPGDTTSEDPGLHSLQDNGGPTRTHAPSPGPWHRFGGSNVVLSDWDQRGVGFPRVSAPDPIEIGAFQTNSGIIFVNGFN